MSAALPSALVRLDVVALGYGRRSGFEGTEECWLFLQRVGMLPSNRQQRDTDPPLCRRTCLFALT